MIQEDLTQETPEAAAKRFAGEVTKLDAELKTAKAENARITEKNNELVRRVIRLEAERDGINDAFEKLVDKMIEKLVDLRS